MAAEMDLSWVSIGPLAGVMIGATLQYLLGRRAEASKRLEQLRSQAYTDYLNALSASAHCRSEEERRNVLRDATFAKNRIVVYGSSKVVARLAEFENSGANVSTETGINALLRLVVAIRSGAPGTLLDEDIKTVLMGSPPSLPRT